MNTQEKKRASHRENIERANDPIWKVHPLPAIHPATLSRDGLAETDNLDAELSAALGGRLGLDRRLGLSGRLGLFGLRGGRATRHLLYGRDATEGTGVGGVGNLDETDVSLVPDGTLAVHSRGQVDLDGVVLVDIGGSLHQAQLDQATGDDAALGGGGDVASGAGNLLDHLGLDALAKGACSGGIDNGRVWTGTISGDNVDGTREATAGGDLREGVTGLAHGIRNHGQGVSTLTSGLAKTIRGNVPAVEDRGVELRGRILSGGAHDRSLDTEGSTVPAGVTHHDRDLSMGRNKRGGGKRKEEYLRKHLE